MTDISASETPILAEALLEVAVRRFRTLDRWGEKAEYDRAVSEVLQRTWGTTT